MIRVFDMVTRHTFVFKNQKDKEEFFDTWDKLVEKVEDKNGKNADKKY